MPNFLTFGITCYNKESTILECIYSCLEVKKVFDQTIEIILIDDNSTDKSLEKIKYHFEKKIKIIGLSHNEGVSNARNVIIEESNAKYLTFIDADDVVNIKGFIDFIKFLKSKENKNYELIFGNYSNLNFENKTLKKIEIFNNKSLLDKNFVIDVVKDYLMRPNKVNLFVQCFAKIYSTKYLKNQKILFNKNLQNFEDVEFLAKCLKNFNSIMGVNFDLYTHKLHSPGNSETYSSKRSIKSHLGFLIAVDQIAESLIALINQESFKSKNIYADIDIDFLKNQAKGSYICITSVMQAFRIKNLNSFFEFTSQIRQAFSSQEVKEVMKSYNSKLSGGSELLAFSIKYNLWLIAAFISFFKFRKRYKVKN